jgi:hypothetical protein
MRAAEAGVTRAKLVVTHFLVNDELARRPLG